MTRALLGVSLVLTWFLLFNVAGSLAVTAALRLGAAAGWRARTAGSLLGLRLLPSAAGLIGLVALVLPAYLWLEPAGAVEPLGPGLLSAALVSTWLTGRALLRAGRGWRLAHADVRAWLHDAERIDRAPFGREDDALPTYVVTDPRPIVALAGVRRPRLFIARQVAEQLSDEELSAAIAHERGHLTARDNLKRLLLRACPDVLALLPAGRRLECAWIGAAELAADARAVGADEHRAAALASAIVKVARMMPPPQPLAAPVSTLHDGGAIADRIHQLVAPRGPQAVSARGPWILTTAVVALAAIAAVEYPALLSAVHQISEALVRLFV